MGTANRLEPVNLTDFTGGLNLRRDQFTLAENESPDMLNVDVDPRGGFYTRRGWERWNAADIGTFTTEWDPTNAVSHDLTDGQQKTFVVESGRVFVAAADAVFTQLAGVTVVADPHGADIVSWGSDVYMACGLTQPSRRYNPAGSVTVLSGSTFSEVDAPTGNTMPQAEYAETHSGYLFVACTMESSVPHYSRVRWSHPNRPDAWRADDYIDIEAGGGRITAIVSFLDHLLVFKTNGLWALFGYDESSWQLTKVSHSIGCPTVTATARSETAVYFWSSSNGGGVYAYNGGQPVYLSEKIKVAMEAIAAPEKVFISFAGRRLWVSVPWHSRTGAMAHSTTAFVFDADVGDGAWTMYRANAGAITSVLPGSDVNARYPLAAVYSMETAAMVRLDVIDDGYDMIMEPGSLGVSPPDDALLVTSTDAEILLTGDSCFESFESYYRTRWLHGGWPDRRKSWRRPTFICRRVPRRVDLLVQQFADYDETTIRRTGLVPGVAQDNSIWAEGGADDPGGLDWGGAGTWGAQVQGASVIRSGSMGHASAVQIKVMPSDHTPCRKWGVDGIVIKLTTARFRT